MFSPAFLAASSTNRYVESAVSWNCRPLRWTTSPAESFRDPSVIAPMISWTAVPATPPMTMPPGPTTGAVASPTPIPTAVPPHVLVVSRTEL
ncbi:hypothetical protein [Streptomyces neyagawaensis]|uniref:hypothetical protein n=1 Tax=Streptomyces neyagawaensis TaxID=42238 RepID=UPI0006E31C31|nr:hypothetical protein [Streptomyces neyagawaensis]MCL6738991.1 hypothetical protein [Streptomyces neyagawaensis]MDE1688214.1 hypothetical protein [Streptomyces neyagawaensis]